MMLEHNVMDAGLMLYADSIVKHRSKLLPIINKTLFQCFGVLGFWGFGVLGFWGFVCDDSGAAFLVLPLGGQRLVFVRQFVADEYGQLGCAHYALQPASGAA